MADLKSSLERVLLVCKNH